MNNTIVLPDGSAFNVVEVMTREEAMKLPPNKRPICYRVSSEMYHLVFELVAEASRCWKEIPPSEEFDHEKATVVMMDLLFKIAEEVESKKFDTY